MTILKAFYIYLNMKTYAFAQIAAREYPTVNILDNPYIWGGVQVCINVSEKPYSAELCDAMKQRGISWLACPVSEDPGDLWLDALRTALLAMITAYVSDIKMIVHCDFGNNRSRTFVEAFYYVLKDEQFHDEYKGEYNHLVYNCKQGHLPPVEETEGFLDSLRPDIQKALYDQAHIKGCPR